MRAWILSLAGVGVFFSLQGCGGDEDATRPLELTGGAESVYLSIMGYPLVISGFLRIFSIFDSCTILKHFHAHTKKQDLADLLQNFGRIFAEFLQI